MVTSILDDFMEVTVPRVTNSPFPLMERRSWEEVTTKPFAGRKRRESSAWVIFVPRKMFRATPPTRQPMARSLLDGREQTRPMTVTHHYRLGARLTRPDGLSHDPFVPRNRETHYKLLFGEYTDP